MFWLRGYVQTGKRKKKYNQKFQDLFQRLNISEETSIRRLKWPKVHDGKNAGKKKLKPDGKAIIEEVSHLKWEEYGGDAEAIKSGIQRICGK